MKKSKNPYELKTGAEMYDYLKNKTEGEVDAYFVERGAVILDNGIMLNNGLYLLYKLEKDSREGTSEKTYYGMSCDGEMDRQG